MPTKESLQHKLDRVRPPRVQITYDVEVGGAIELKELPFVVGVLGDFTGKPEEPLEKEAVPLLPRPMSIPTGRVISVILLKASPGLNLYDSYSTAARPLTACAETEAGATSATPRHRFGHRQEEVYGPGAVGSARRASRADH